MACYNMQLEFLAKNGNLEFLRQVTSRKDEKALLHLRVIFEKHKCFQIGMQVLARRLRKIYGKVMERLMWEERRHKHKIAVTYKKATIKFPCAPDRPF